jgi:hypothetical protein
MASSKNKQAAALAMATTVAIVFFGRPSNGWLFFLCAILAGLLIYGFCDYPSRTQGAFPRFVRWLALVLTCTSVSAFWGYCWWQGINVSPGRANFRGFSSETINFSVRNNQSDDAYDVQVPFLVGYGKHFEDKLSVKVIPTGEPSSLIHVDYNYCFGEKGDGIVSHVMPNEREILIAKLEHIPPSVSRTFTVTYTGGEPLSMKLLSPDSADEPNSYSLNQGTFGVRGDFRICKFAVHADKPGDRQ